MVFLFFVPDLNQPVSQPPPLEERPWTSLLLMFLSGSLPSPPPLLPGPSAVIYPTPPPPPSLHSRERFKYSHDPNPSLASMSFPMLFFIPPPTGQASGGRKTPLSISSFLQLLQTLCCLAPSPLFQQNGQLGSHSGPPHCPKPNNPFSVHI